MPFSPASETHRPGDSTDQMIRRVMVGQMLFTAGNSLTTGAFLSYFVYAAQSELVGPARDWRVWVLTAVLVIPEMAHSVSALLRPVMLQHRNRRRNWLLGVCGGRLASIGIPLSLILADLGWESGAILILLASLICWYLCQGFGYVNYLSWLSDLVPEVNWGALFSRRQKASLCVLLIVPLVASVMREQWFKGMSPALEQWSYAVIFGMGTLLCLSSILPLWRFPDVPWKPVSPIASGTLDWEGKRSFLWLVTGRWWLAFFQGLTQTVFFLYSVNVLKISLPLSLAFSAGMTLLQIPAAGLAGRWSDAQRDKLGLMTGLLIAGGALPLSLLATSEFRWPYALMIFSWGAFGLVNVCGTNLCLKLAPRGDNTMQLALYEQVSGLIAGLAGILGSTLLHRWLAMESGLAPDSGLTPEVSPLWPYHLLILVSWGGRLLTLVWLGPIRQPAARPTGLGSE